MSREASSLQVREGEGAYTHTIQMLCFHVGTDQRLDKDKVVTGSYEDNVLICTGYGFFDLVVILRFIGWIG